MFPLLRSAYVTALRPCVSTPQPGTPKRATVRSWRAGSFLRRLRSVVAHAAA